MFIGFIGFIEFMGFNPKPKIYSRRQWGVLASRECTRSCKWGCKEGHCSCSPVKVHVLGFRV